MNVLVLDVGGTNLKMLVTGRRVPLKIPSGPDFTPRDMVRAVRRAARDWAFDVVSIGYPGPVVHGRPLHEPHNLGPGWVGFDFTKALGCPVRIINDAAMQALGSYEGGRMFFLGLGTGLGAAAIDDGVLEPLELAHLPYRKGKTFEDYLGERGLKRLGRKRWEKHVHKVAEQLCKALVCDYIVIGGGNARLLRRKPRRARIGGNANAFIGGFRLWNDGAAVARRSAAQVRRRRARHR